LRFFWDDWRRRRFRFYWLRVRLWRRWYRFNKRRF